MSSYPITSGQPTARQSVAAAALLGIIAELTGASGRGNSTFPGYFNGQPVTSNNSPEFATDLGQLGNTYGGSYNLGNDPTAGVPSNLNGILNGYPELGNSSAGSFDSNPANDLDNPSLFDAAANNEFSPGIAGPLELGNTLSMALGNETSINNPEYAQSLQQLIG